MDRMKKFLVYLAFFTLIVFGVFAIKSSQIFYLLIGFGLCLGLAITYLFWNKFG
ncbi:hypothetical protein B279_05905 [Streptococcus equinus ATCC 33317]|nr:hypothetical protein B279_05905 [Streptococcus equinus ATCC 33317]